MQWMHQLHYAIFTELYCDRARIDELLLLQYTVQVLSSR